MVTIHKNSIHQGQVQFHDLLNNLTLNIMSCFHALHTLTVIQIRRGIKYIHR